MPKKQWTEEERKAFGEKMKAAKAARENPTVLESTPGILPPLEPVAEPDEDVTTLDLTKENLVNESSVTELVRRMFDEGKYPDVIRITSHQMIETFDPSNRTTMKLDGIIYQSPFGEHWVEVIPRKELDENNQNNLSNN